MSNTSLKPKYLIVAVSLIIYCLLTSFITILFVNNTTFIKYYLPADIFLIIGLIYHFIFGTDVDGLSFENIAITLPFAIGLLILITLISKLTSIII